MKVRDVPIDRDSRHGLVVVNTGEGKGKTTAALGLLLRAWGRGWNVCVLQFVKSTTSNFGEHRAAKKLGVEIIPLGDGCIRPGQATENDEALARRCWELSTQKLASGEYDLIILDEITFPLNYGWISIDNVLAALDARPKGLHVVVTGRDAPEALVEYADLVTDMREVKHPYRTQGLRGQPGIEF